MGGWRYIASKMNGDGTETFLSFDVPLVGASVGNGLSSPDSIRGSISPEYARLKDSTGSTFFRPYSTCIYAEMDGQIRSGGILTGLSENGPSLAVEVSGFTTFSKDVPYKLTFSGVQVDPLDMFRKIWAYVQTQPRSNLGIVVDTLKSPIKIGTPEEDVNFTTGAGDDVSFTAGPYTLNWWDTDDLGGETDKLAGDTPFDYRMDLAWSGEKITKNLRLGYPKLGAKRDDLRFELGQNIVGRPTVTYEGDDYANEIVVLGSGSGSAMIRGGAVKNDGRLRKVKTVADSGIDKVADANTRAQTELTSALGDKDITSLTIRDHPYAPYGSYSVGDDILVQNYDSWSGTSQMWVRVMGIDYSPDDGQATLTTTRSDKVQT
jgi:hypothetical protein